MHEILESSFHTSCYPAIKIKNSVLKKHEKTFVVIKLMKKPCGNIVSAKKSSHCDRNVLRIFISQVKTKLGKRVALVKVSESFFLPMYPMHWNRTSLSFYKFISID